VRPAEPDRAPVVLMYHSVAPCQVDPFQVTVCPQRFARQMRLLHRLGIRGTSMRELLDGPDRAGPRVGLTFDDGYRDFLTGALPVLLRYGFTATVFVVAGSLGADNDWDRGGPRKRLLDARQVRQVAEAGMEIGSHGLRHVRLPALPQPLLRRELQQSRQILEHLTGGVVTGFCYPFGQAGQREVTAVRSAGYGYGCVGRHIGLAGRHAMQRIYVGDRDGAARLAAKWVRDRLSCCPQPARDRSRSRPEGVGVR
jgi:peptidoglycan/xylan/chitin deacetylase (PgdA/CDA1 family)